MELWSDAIEKSRSTNRNVVLMFMIELLQARAGRSEFVFEDLLERKAGISSKFAHLG